jgi:protein SCO1/2
VADAAGFRYRLDPASREYSHPSGIVVLTPGGKISRYFFGIRFDAAQLHRALREAKGGTIGSWAEAVLLFCFHYDPQLSRNGPLILKALRWASVAAVLAIAALLAWLSRARAGAPGSRP